MAVTFGGQGLTVRAAGGGGIGPTGPTGPTGATGAIGQGFVIAQVYNSEAERIAATGASLPGDGEFALIAGTLSQSDADYGKLYLWKNGAWVYQTDMSVQGIMGPQGIQGAAGATGATGIGYAGLTSSSSWLIGTGSKTFVTNLAATSTAFAVGQRVRVASSAAPANYMEGAITSFSSSSMIVSVDLVGGSGTISSWNISAAGAQGTAGATGSSYYDVALFYSGKPTASEVILRHVVARAFNLTATASSHKLLVGTNPSSSADIKISKFSSGSTTIIMYIRVATNGTITYRDATNAATLTTLATTSLAVGDQLLITAPTSADSTMADIHVTLTGLAV